MNKRILFVISALLVIAGGILAFKYLQPLKPQAKTNNAVAGIEVLSPNGGETWVKGQPAKILWQSDEAIKYVNIRLGVLGNTDAQNFNAALASQILNDNSFDWTVQDLYAEVWGTTTLPVSDQYILTVEDSEHSNIYDVSDAPFKVIDAPQN